MGTRPTLRAIVCDDDPVLCNVLVSMLQELRYHVVGSADSISSARDLLDRYEVDVVILDLALIGGSGEHLLAWLRDERPGIHVAVFSAFVQDPTLLLEAGADAVFQKPDFDGLEGWLSAERDPVPPAAPTGFDRRRPAQPAPPLPDKGPTSPSGLEPWPRFAAAVDGLWPGDAVLALDLLGFTDLGRCGDPAFVQDHRLSLSRLVAPTLRELDRVACAPSGVIVVLLVAGHPEAAPTVFDRLELAWDRAGLVGIPVGSFARVQSAHGPVATLARVLDVLHDSGTTAQHPLRLA